MKSKKSIVRGGFTLVELAVVIVIIGVLAAFAVPKFRAAVERSKAAEAVNYLSSIQAGQERYHARQGEYCIGDVNQLDITFTTPKYFSVGTITTTDQENNWSLILTRSGTTGGYSSYTVIYNQDGYDPTSTINAIPKINPMTQT